MTRCGKQSVKQWRFDGWSLLTAVALMILLSACDQSKGADSAATPAMPVQVQAVETRSIGATSEYEATIKSRNSATIMSDVEGWIFDIRVHSGELVKKGDTLMEIDPRRQRATVSNYDSQRNSKQATLEWATVQFRRAKDLYASGVISKQDLDQAQSTYDSAAADVKSLDAQITEQQVQLKYYSVFAPTDGIVGDVPVHVGDRVTNTTPLTTIDERKGLEVYIQVPAEHAHDVRVGTPVDVLDVEGHTLLSTKIYFVSPQIDTNTQSVLAKAPADAAADKLRAMELVRARITWSTSPGVTVPVVAVSRVSGQFFAFVAENDNGKLVARQRPLELGEIVGNDYQVLSGLKAGDKVIVAGGQNLAEGAVITIQQ